jgi:uridylate kinase
MDGPEPIYRRILLKMSGEALMGDGQYSIDPKVLDRMARDISAVY